MTAPLTISALANGVAPSATLTVAARAAELRAQGRDVIDLSVGEPDFEPPQAVREAVARAVATQPMRYTAVAGTPELREAVAQWLGAYHGRPFGKEQVLVSCGAKHSIANLLLATLDPGDEVVIPAPYWVSYPDMVRLAGGKPVVVPSTAENGWRVTPAALEAALGERTRFVVLNSPCNPTGAGYRAEDVRALGEVVARKAPRAWWLVDDIYRQLTYDGFAHASVFRSLAGVSEQVVLVDGVSKTFAMTGYRIGFLVAPTEVVKAATKIQGQTTSNAATPSQLGALVALTDPSVAADVQAMHRAFASRRTVILEALGAAPGLRLRPPDGAFYAWAALAAGADDGAVAQSLLDDALVACVPGSAFGAPGHLRFSYATDEATIRNACTRVAEVLSRR